MGMMKSLVIDAAERAKRKPGDGGNSSTAMAAPAVELPIEPSPPWPVESVVIDYIDPPPPCSACNSLALWESIASGPKGHGPPVWRCLECDPPKTARRLRIQAKVIRARPARSAVCDLSKKKE